MNRSSASAVYHHNGVVTEPKSAPLADTVELSEHARLIGQLRKLPEVRADVVERARNAVNDPAYLSEERLNVALERLIDDLHLDEQLDA